MKHDNDLVMVVGGIDLLVTLLNGDTKTMRVHVLTLNDAQIYLALAVQNDEAGMIDLFCRQESGFHATLTLKSQDEIIEKGEELNSDFMMRCAARAKARREKLTPGFEEKAIKEIVDRLEPSLRKLLPKGDTATPSSPTAVSAKSTPSSKKPDDGKQTTR